MGYRNGSPDLCRLPPHAPEAEQAVLSCILQDPTNCLPECVAFFGKSGEEVFYDLRHQLLFGTMLEMVSKGAPIDFIALQQQLHDRKQLDQCGGTAYLLALQDIVPSPANLEYYLGIAKDKFLLRKLVRTCTDTVGRVYEFEGEVAALFDQTERDLLAIRTFQTRLGDKSIKEVVGTCMEDFDKAANKKDAVDGIPTGLYDLDSLSGGMHEGEAIIVAGFTSQGKTAIAMNIVENVLLESNLPVGVFSLEMTCEELTKRMICSNARVNLRDVRRGLTTQEEMTRLVQASARIAGSPLHIDETSGLSVMELRARARRMKSKSGIALFVVDYLQLLSGGAKHYEKKQEELDDIGRAIKILAKELSVPIIAISQLNDQGKLFGSRAIGHHGNSVWKLKRMGKDDHSDTLAVKLLVSKNRNGPTGEVDLTFIRKFTRFESAAKVP